MVRQSLVDDITHERMLGTGLNAGDYAIMQRDPASCKILQGDSRIDLVSHLSHQRIQSDEALPGIAMKAVLLTPSDEG